MQKLSPADRKEAALYWAAVSLIVCEGLPLQEAAERLHVDPESLREIFLRRDAVCSLADSDLWQ